MARRRAQGQGIFWARPFYHSPKTGISPPGTKISKPPTRERRLPISHSSIFLLAPPHSISFHARAMTSAAPAVLVRAVDLRPTASRRVSMQLVVLECTQANLALVADATGSLYLSGEGIAASLQPGEIIQVNNAVFNFPENSTSSKPMLTLAKDSQMLRLGEFNMVFSETPNLSTIEWIRKTANAPAMPAQSLPSTWRPPKC